MAMDAVNDLAFLRVRVGSDGELGARGGFGSWCPRWSGVDGFRVTGKGGWIDECDGRGAELCLGGDDFDGVVEDVGGRHVVLLW